MEKKPYGLSFKLNPASVSQVNILGSFSQDSYVHAIAFTHIGKYT